MRDREIDELIARSAAAEPVDSGMIERLSASISGSTAAVRPIWSAGVLISGLLLISGLVALAGAGRRGFYGLQKMSDLDIVLIFSLLAVLAWLAAAASAAEMTPGSGRLLSPLHLMLIGSVAMAALFGLVFHDLAMDRFMPQGFACLKAGLTYALPAGVLSWVLLRRGFAVNAIAAGLAAGTFAGLTGVTMLELHCPIFHSMHVMIWHTAVVPLSGLVGAIGGATRNATRSWDRP